jgi:hypothetical protein
VRGLEYLQHLQHLQHLDRLSDMDHLMVHLFRCVVEIVNLDQMYRNHRRHRRHRQDVEKMDVLQIQDEQNLDAVLTFLDAVRHFLVNLVDAQVVAELHHLLKMDCYQDVEDAEPRRPLKMDCYQDEVQASVLLLPVRSLLEYVVLELALLLSWPPLLPLREMPSKHQDLHQVLLLILLRVRDQPRHSFWQRSFLQLPS